MSRIGKKTIEIPEGVDVKIDNGVINVKGPKGELSYSIRKEIVVEIKDKKKLSEKREIFVSANEKMKNSSAFWGLTRTLIFNMIEGVSNGYSKKLEIIGVGYSAFVEGKDLVLKVGHSHPVKINAPFGIEFDVKKNIVTVSGIDKVLVGQIASNIRKVRKPEPYKGKGIKYIDEIIRRKEGKKTAA